MNDGAHGGAAAFASKSVSSDASALTREFPAFLERSRRLLRLAELAATGPDPEALLPDVAELHRHCAAFLRTHG